MKKNLTFVVFATLFALIFASCSLPRTAVLKPQVPAQFIDRDGFAMQKGDSIDVTFGYLFSTRDYLVFEVAVKNNSSDSILVDATRFTYHAVGDKDTARQVQYFRAQSFKQINDKLTQRVREQHIKIAVLTLATVAAVVAIDAKTQKNRPPQYRDYYWSVRTGVDLSFNYFDAVIFNQLSKKEARQGLERSYMFPKKIGASETHIGAVYFPRFDAASELTFNFATNEQDFITQFKQKIERR